MRKIPRSRRRSQLFQLYRIPQPMLTIKMGNINKSELPSRILNTISMRALHAYRFSVLTKQLQQNASRNAFRFEN
jgi:hypothetical protein